MIHRSITTLALAGCMLAPLASFAAENNTNITQAKGPMVHVTLKNLSNLTQNLVIEGRPVSLAANEEYKVEAPAGTLVYGADKTVKLTLVRDYNGAVASFR
ncbi:MAG: hypothetical protein ACRYGF_08425 [Janthinobacterium lividum]